MGDIKKSKFFILVTNLIWKRTSKSFDEAADSRYHTECTSLDVYGELWRVENDKSC